MGGEARHRAKVYCLNDEGQWDDRGTGHAAVQYVPVRPWLPPPCARGRGCLARALTTSCSRASADVRRRMRARSLC